MTCFLPMWWLGCSTVRQVNEVTFQAPGATDVFTDLERGDFLYVGQTDHDPVDGVGGKFDLGIAVWARSDRDLGSVVWGAQYLEHPTTAPEGGLLDVWGRSPEAGSGTDVVVLGPTTQDLEIVLLDGVAELADVRGEHVVTAAGIFGSGLSGQLDLYAESEGATLEMFPSAGDELRLEAFGDVTLYLPFGVDVDLEVTADPDFGVSVADLGFDALEVFPDQVLATSGDRSTQVRIVVEDGLFTLLETSP